MYSEEDLIKEKEKKKKEEKQKRVDKFLGTKETNKVKQEKDEEFYDDFFKYEEENDIEYDIEDEPDLEPDTKKESRSKLGIIIILLLVLIVIGILLLTSLSKKKEEPNEVEPSVTITLENIEINQGEDGKINYNLENFKDDPKVSFVSSDPNVVTVDNEGVIKAINPGEAKIIMSYFIKDVSYQKEITIKVNEVKKDEPTPTPVPEKPKEEEKPKPTKDTTKPTLSVTISNAKENTYVNHDVEIKVSAKDNSGKVTVQYAFNCSSSCKYQNVSNNKVIVKDSGTTVVSIQAVDPSGNKVVKSVTIKIDKSKPSCVLKVGTDGTLSANVTDNLGLMEYYGFNSSYTGSKEQSKKITSEGKYVFYVKDTAGNTNTCEKEVHTKVQYRSRTCSATNKTFSAWFVSKQAYATSCGAYGKGESERAGNTWYRTRTAAASSYCNGASTCYYCTTYARGLTGCNWGNEEWGPYQDAKIESSNIIQVQQANIFY